MKHQLIIKSLCDVQEAACACGGWRLTATGDITRTEEVRFSVYRLYAAHIVGPERALPPGPWTAKENRVYAADGEEIIVATRASSKWRTQADWTALAAAALPSVADALKVLLLDSRIRAFLRENDPKALAQALVALIDVDPDIYGKVLEAERLATVEVRDDE